MNEKWQRGREAVTELSGRLSDAGFGHDFWFNGLYDLCAERSAEGLNEAELIEAVERLRRAELRLHALGKGHLADIRFPREAEAHGLGLSFADGRKLAERPSDPHIEGMKSADNRRPKR